MIDIISYNKDLFSEVKRLRILLNEEESSMVIKDFPNRFLCPMPERNTELRISQFIDLETKKLNPDSLVYFASYKGRVVGFISMLLIYSKMGKDYIYVNSLYVEKDYRRKGIAKKLMQKAIDFSESKKLDLELEVYANNSATGFYKSMGMNPCWITYVRNSKE